MHMVNRFMSRVGVNLISRKKRNPLQKYEVNTKKYPSLIQWPIPTMLCRRRIEELAS